MYNDFSRIADSLGFEELPSSQATEELLLAKFVQSPDIAQQLALAITDEVFYHKGNKALFKAIKSVSEETIPTIPAIVIHLEKNNQLRDVAASDLDEAIETLDAFQSMPISPGTNWKEVLDHLGGLALQRNSVAAIDKYRRQLIQKGANPTQILLDLETEIVELRQAKEVQDLSGHFEQVVDRSIESLSAELQAEESTNPKTSHLYDLNQATDGFPKGTVHFYCGPTGLGKSHLMIDLGTDLAKQGFSTFFLSLEMPERQVWSRITANRLGIDSRCFHSPKDNLPLESQLAIWNDRHESKKLPIYIHNEYASLDAAIAKANNEFIKRGQRKIDVLFFDYLQMACTRGDNATFEIAALSRRLKNLAMRLDICVVALVQLDMDRISKRNDKRPTITDVSESKLSNNAADVIALMHSQDYWAEHDKNPLPDGHPEKGALRLYYDKVRYKAACDIKLWLEKSTSRLTSAAHSAGGGVNDTYYED